MLEPPIGEAIKINCDAAVKRGMAVIACVARDAHSSILECVGSKLPSHCSMLMAESLAIKEAHLLCIKDGFDSATIENASSVMISWCLKEDGVPPWDISAVIADIRSLSEGRSFSFSSVRRSANQVAHWVAKFCLSCGSWNLNVGNFPPSLLSIVRV